MGPFVGAVVLAISAVFFLFQLYLCFHCRSVFRYVPVAVLGSVGICLWLDYFLIRPGFYTYYGAMVVLYWTFAVSIAWLLSGIVHLIQKRKE